MSGTTEYNKIVSNLTCLQNNFFNWYLYCQIEPSTGTAMTTDFTVRAADWFQPVAPGFEDETIPESLFLYKFAYQKKKSNEQDLVYLKPFSEDSEITIKLPSGR